MRDDLDREAIQQRARATLARLERGDRERALERLVRGPDEGDGAFRPDVLEHWQKLREQSAEPPRRPPPPKPPQPRTSNAMDPAQVREYVRDQLAGLVELIGDECGRADRALQNEITKLRAEVQELRAELQASRGELRGEPLELPDWRHHVAH